ncbi:uncharacterized protein LOC118456476 [Anopheles albimanus]|uniref:Uncharacterized protein n=1 Tax=Anopheles albimanus TaxID=7167 RepID=A0A182FPC8_ANOAL|nr:uncharacterized protein LOC118456476 [Anopheles albimanus]XP_035773180.1 uncharacterized protein LOC118456476 [Anopheles albimanus]
MSTVELRWQVVRDLAIHKLRFGQVNEAIETFTEALAVAPPAPTGDEDGESAKVLAGKASAELAASTPDRAVDTLRKSGTNYPATLLRCRALYGVADLEQHLLTAANDQRAQGPPGGHRNRELEAEVDLGRSTFDAVLGDRAGASLLEYRHRFPQIKAEQRLRKAQTIDRPRWKVLAEAGECDVISVQETVRQEPPIRERARRETNSRILGQLYLGRGWKDWMFCKELRPDGRHGATVNLPQTPDSSSAMMALIEECCQRTSAFIKQSQARCPLYSHRFGRFGSPAKRRREWNELDQLLRYRYRAYRAVYRHLDHLHELRAARKSVQLFRYAGEILRDFYKITTVRVLPDKGQLVREICNLIGLTIVDGLRIPVTLMDEPAEKRLLALFAVPPAKETVTVIPVFGDISTYRDPTEPDHSFLRYKAKITELEGQYQRVQYPIERCFLDHEMARHHLHNGWLDDVKVMGTRMVEEAIGCGSHLWRLIGHLTIAKALCAQNNLEQLAKLLCEVAEFVSLSLPDERIAFFVELAQKLTQGLLNRKQDSELHPSS